MSTARTAGSSPSPRSEAATGRPAGRTRWVGPSATAANSTAPPTGTAPPRARSSLLTETPPPAPWPSDDRSGDHEGAVREVPVPEGRPDLPAEGPPVRDR